MQAGRDVSIAHVKENLKSFQMLAVVTSKAHSSSRPQPAPRSKQQLQCKTIDGDQHLLLACAGLQENWSAFRAERNLRALLSGRHGDGAGGGG